ncbi:MAG: ATP-binding cassette domain-containing protein [Bacillota bacterium]
MINIQGVTKSFGRITAVSQAELAVNRHEIFGLVGPDGAGKTTLMRMVCGLIEPDQGQVVLFGGENHSELNKARLGYMPQRFSLYGDLTVMENINFFGGLYGLKKATIQQRAAEILQITNLQDFTDRLADNLSGGMKQKLALTCALITRPELLILDEPTYGVDPESRKEFWKILYRLNKEGVTVMVSTPYMDEAELCHRVAIMNEGRVVAVNTPLQLKRGLTHHLLEIRADTRDPYVFEGLSDIKDCSFFGDRFHLAVADVNTAACRIREYLAQRQIRLETLQEVPPSMEDVFVALTDNGVRP